MSTQREKELEALHQVAVASSGVLDPASLGRLVVEHARDLLAGDEATLLLYDEAAQGLRVIADTHRRPFSRIIAVGEGTAGIAFQRMETVAVEDYPSWEHAVKDSLPRGLKSVLATPLLVRSVPIGALTVSFNTARQFHGEELRVLALLATQIAPAIEAARLHDEVVRVGERLEQTNEALKEANRHKSIFLANMSHELRTPLNAIIGFSELLTDDREGRIDPATRKRFQDQILTAGRHLLSLINDILDLSKVESGQMELRLQQVPVAEVVEQVARSVEPLVAKKQIRLTVDAALAGEVTADAGKLKQMLINLVSNAIKFTPEGGAVAIRAAGREGHLELSVADTGVGIADKDKAQLFREFHQIDQGPGRRQEGTGLGLALTKRLAMLHGGDVTFTSKPGEGSVFTITLPRGGAVADTATPGGTGPTVLVVEDDHAAAELLVRQLSEAGFSAQVARSGEEAIDLARRTRPDAMTIDIRLPGVDGWELITRLKADPSTRSIPILVVTVVDQPERGISLGAVDYFVKPIQAAELVARLNRLVPRGQEAVRVLVVDDQEENREWLAHTLEPAGFAISVAAGGRQGIELARSGHPDCVVLDLLMPEVSGFDVVEELRADAATRETPIMILTSADLTEADKQALTGRVSTILSRGATDANQLVESLKRAVGTRGTR